MTAQDSNQTGSDGDQTAVDDEQGADSDQAASDRDLAPGGDPGGRDLTLELRDRSARRRQQVGRARVDTGVARDAVAHARDMAAFARDEAAEVHERELETRDAAWRGGEGAKHLRRVADDRSRAAADRAAAAAGRARAARDRERAADDRKQAGRDRLQSQAERGKLLRELAITDTDRLTGGRAAGLADLGREIDRARRGTDELVVACVNVVAGNAVREADGDALLLRTVCAIRARLRSYDLIVGLEGNAFLCLISAATIQIVRQRFAAVQAALATDPDLCEIRVGVAALAPEDSAAELVKRAVAEMPSSRRPRFP